MDALPLYRPSAPHGQDRAGPFFFQEFRPGLEGRLQRLLQEIPAVSEQERLAAVDDLPVRGGFGGRFQFLGQDQSLLDDQSLHRGEGVEVGREHGCIILCVPVVRTNRRFINASGKGVDARRRSNLMKTDEIERRIAALENDLAGRAGTIEQRRMQILCG